MARGLDLGKHPNAFDVTRRLSTREWLNDFSRILTKDLGSAAIAAHLEPNRLTLLDRREMARTLLKVSRLGSFPAEQVKVTVLRAFGEDFDARLPVRLARPEIFERVEAGERSRYYLRIPFINPRLGQESRICRAAIDGATEQPLEWAAHPKAGINVAELDPGLVDEITPEDLTGLKAELPRKISLEPGRIAGKLASELPVPT